MRKILVTGGAGFIGSNFIRYLLQTYPECQIVNLDLLTYAGNLQNLEDTRRDTRYRFVRGDIADGNLCREWVADGVEAIVNFAAESHVDRSIADPSVFVRTNVLGTQALLEAARNFGVKRFIQVSTDEVYGSLGTCGMFTEDSSLAPNSPYAASKAAADHLVHAYGKTYGLPVNITRCCNNYGPFQHPEKLIPRMITLAIDEHPLPIYGDGLYVRDWLHVWDHCRAIDLVLRQGSPQRVYNIGGNCEMTNLEIVERILAKLVKPASLIRHVKDRPGHDRRYAIDAGRIRRELGWRPEYSLERGLDETVKWYLDHSEWWRKADSCSGTPINHRQADIVEEAILAAKMARTC